MPPGRVPQEVPSCPLLMMPQIKPELPRDRTTDSNGLLAAPCLQFCRLKSSLLTGWVNVLLSSRLPWEPERSSRGRPPGASSACPFEGFHTSRSVRRSTLLYASSTTALLILYLNSWLPNVRRIRLHLEASVHERQSI